jgi:DNA-directed RNA polymerase specialized sigma24 family protein
MHPDTASAVLILQDRLRAVESRDFRRAERYEAALDDLIRNPERAGPVGHLVRNAASYGLKRTARRSRLAPRQALTREAPDRGVAAHREVLVTHDDAAQLAIDLHDLLDRAPLTDFERSALRRLAGGAETRDIASDVAVPLPTVQVRISRARAKARAVA